MSKVLSRMPSDILQMTFAELDEARGAGEDVFANISMDELFANWGSAVPQAPIAAVATAALAEDVPVAKKRLDRQDTSWKGKTLDDVWKAINDTHVEKAAAATGGANNRQKTEVTLQQVLQSFLDDPATLSIEPLPAPASARHAAHADAGVGAPDSALALAAADTPGEKSEAARQARQNRMLKRKAKALTEDAPTEESEAARHAKERMVKNRESAARSRAKRQQYTAELEEQVNKLKKENVNLKREVVLKGEAADASKHSMRLRSGRSAPPAYFHKQLSLHETIEELKKQQRK